MKGFGIVDVPARLPGDLDAGQPGALWYGMPAIQMGVGGEEDPISADRLDALNNFRAGRQVCDEPIGGNYEDRIRREWRAATRVLGDRLAGARFP